MKISLDAVKTLARASRSKLSPEDVENEEGETVRIYSLEDFTISFLIEDKPKFFGLTFNALAQEFTVLSSLDLLVFITDNEGEAAYEIEDEDTIRSLENYVLWRASMLETTGL